MLLHFFAEGAVGGDKKGPVGSFVVSNRYWNRTTLVQLGVALSLAWMVTSAATGGARRVDARTLLLSGSVFMDGGSPYDPGALNEAWVQEYGEARPSHKLFVYPPTILAVLGPLAAVGSFGFVLLDALNAVALGLLLWAVWRKGAQLGLSTLRRWLAVLLVSLTGGIGASLLLGQVGLWSIAPLAWMMPTGKTSLPFGLRVLCITAAALKPTIALPFIAYWLLTDTAALFVAGGLSLAVSVWVAATTSGPAMLSEWLTSLRMYSAEAVNLPDKLVSLQHVLAGVLPEGALRSFPAVAALGGLLVGLQGRLRGVRSGHFILLTALLLCFMPLHPYDLAVVAVLAGLAPMLGWSSLLWYAPALILLMRSSAVARVGQVLSDAPLDANLLASLGAVMMIVGASVTFLRRNPLPVDPSPPHHESHVHRRSLLQRGSPARHGRVCAVHRGAAPHLIRSRQ